MSLSCVQFRGIVQLFGDMQHSHRHVFLAKKTLKSYFAREMGLNHRNAKSFTVKGELPELTEIRHNFFETRRKGKLFSPRVHVLFFFVGGRGYGGNVDN